MDLLTDVALNIPIGEWEAVFDELREETLGVDDRGDRTLGVFRAGLMDEERVLREQAKLLLACGAQVVVFGHTHQPDSWEEGEKSYFNPGSWTRYATLKELPSLTIEDLKNEGWFPYALQYVRVEETPSTLTPRKHESPPGGVAGGLASSWTSHVQGRGHRMSGGPGKADASTWWAQASGATRTAAGTQRARIRVQPFRAATVPRRTSRYASEIAISPGYSGAPWRRVDGLCSKGNFA